MEQTIESETHPETKRARRRGGRVERIAAVGVLAVLVGVAGIVWAGGTGSGRAASPAPTTKPTEAPATPAAAPTPDPPQGNDPAGVTPAAVPVDPPEPEPVLEDGRHPVLLTHVDTAGATVEFDLVQFLTGDEANRAWAERYPNSPPGAPNDYLVVNDNPRLRTLPVLSGVPVTVAYLDPMGGSDSSPIAFADLPGYLSRFNSGASKHPSGTFWLTVHDDTIVDIHEQWVP
jgi:hypothetical protein